MQYDNSTNPNALLFELKWDMDFYDQMYYPKPAPGKPDKFDLAKKEFEIKTSRQNALPATGENIWVGMYGLMLKRALGCNDPKFVQQGLIVGVVFEFYEQGGALKVNAFGSNSQRAAIEGKEQDPIGDLYKTLEGDLNPNLSFSYPSSDLLKLMGFKDSNNYPTCTRTNITLYPVITSVLYNGGYQTRISLACELPNMSGNKGDSAYAPPCPPFCYP